MINNLEICHPHEFLQDGWRTVMTCEDAEDHLQSPTFECYDGLLARIRRGDYRGDIRAYHDGGFVYIECFREFPWKGDEFQSWPIGWLGQWKESEEPEHMLSAIQHVLPREKLSSAIVELNRYVIRDDPMDLEDAIGLLESPVDNRWEPMIDHLESRYQILFNSNIIDIEIEAFAIRSVLKSLRWLSGDDMQSTIVSSVLESIGNYAENKRIIAHLLRRYVKIEDIIHHLASASSKS